MSLYIYVCVCAHVWLCVCAFVCMHVLVFICVLLVIVLKSVSPPENLHIYPPLPREDKRKTRARRYSKQIPTPWKKEKYKKIYN